MSPPGVEIVAFEVEPGRVELEPAPSRRTWMDETPAAFAYRCLPLTVANAHGWLMTCKVGLEVTWNGGPAVSDLTVKVDGDGTRRRRRGGAVSSLMRAVTAPEAEPEAEGPPANFVESHFGGGIVTFNPMIIVRTTPGTNLWVGPPPNWFKDGVQCLTAIMETDWMPFTFSVNWKVTRPNQALRFAPGDPLCCFFPLARGAVDACDPVRRPLRDDPELEASYRASLAARNVGALFGTGKDRFQGWYTRGVKPTDGTQGAPDHATAVQPRPFRGPTDPRR